MPMFGLYHGIKNYVARHAACRGISYATALHGMPRAVTALEVIGGPLLLDRGRE